MSRELTWRVPKRRLFTTPIPVETSTYKPVSHKEIANTVLKAIKKAGFTIGRQEYYCAKEGMIANARYTIKDLSDEDMQLELAWQNSYDKTLSFKFAIGTRIFVCENGCVFGDFGSYKKRHTGDVKEGAISTIESLIAEANSIFKIMQVQKEKMKSFLINPTDVSNIIGDLFLYKKMLHSTQLNIIRKELESPSYDYGAPGSLWELYQYVTYSMKSLHPRLWMEDHIKIHKYFTETREHLLKKHVFTTHPVKPKDAFNLKQIDLEDMINEIEKEEE